MKTRAAAEGRPGGNTREDNSLQAEKKDAGDTLTSDCRPSG